MADFCRQCSLELFGEDLKEFAGLSKPEDTAKEMFCHALCEGCGPIQVDHDGVCVSDDCSEKGHKLDIQPKRPLDQSESEMTSQDFYQTLRTNVVAHPEWRYGQTVWNTACTMYPEFAEPYRATEFDPFYRDDVADTFINKVLERVYGQKQALAKDS